MDIFMGMVGWSGIVIFFISLPLMLWLSKKYYKLGNEDVFFISCMAGCLALAWPIFIAIGLMYGFAWCITWVIRKTDNGD